MHSVEEFDIDAAFAQFGSCASPRLDRTADDADCSATIEEQLQMLLSSQVNIDDEMQRGSSCVNTAKDEADGFVDTLSLCAEDVPCTCLLIVFSSLSVQVDGSPPGSRFEMVGTARRAGATHALFVRDTQQAWYLRAHKPGGDAFGSTFSRVYAEVDRLQPSLVVCCGSSMGGHAAARCAMELGRTGGSKTCRGHLRAVRALCFGAQVCLHPHERAALGLPFATFDPALERLAAKAAGRGFALRSLVDIAARPIAEYACKTTLEMHVGAIARGDVREAMLLQHAASTAAKSNPIVPDGAKATGGGGGDSDSVDDHHNLLAVRVHVHERCGHALVTGLHGQQLDNMIAKQLRPPVPQVQASNNR